MKTSAELRSAKSRFLGMSDIAVRDKDYAEVLAYEKKLVDSIDELTRTIDISEQSFEAQMVVEALAMKAGGLIL